ncbi:probable F-box protein At4g22030 [Vigna radiata var. radiata]|uniref:Probable F-box protein At4g22030 n=1 Tax=Vigna radiata var. radiata TaxID=3916 RepID=A0A1S3VGL0_VIGRR|nr:probable F-box protein At4g22030 [Vigna radiata var. radiata]
MSSLKISSFLSNSFCSTSPSTIKSSLHLQKKLHIPLSVTPNLKPSRKLFQELNGFSHTIPVLQDNSVNNSTTISTPSKATIIQLYAILEAVADRVEMHHNIGDQRDNWNTLLLNSVNMLTLSASAMVGLAASIGGGGAPLLALKLSSMLLFSASTGMLVVMNKIQPSQLAEEQRNATRLFKQLQSHIETTIAIGNPTEEDVKEAMQRVLALDKAYPLPLLGAMLEKFPKKFEPAVWWPSAPKGINSSKYQEEKQEGKNNGWNKGLEMELRNVLEVVKEKDMKDYERLGNLVLKVNKSLAIAGPLLTGIAAVGSACVTEGSSWGAIVAVIGGALATTVNAFEHGGQVGMVSEMYRNCGGFFKQLEKSIQDTMEEDEDQRENGELFEMKLALKLGRSLSQLRDLARKSAYSRVEGTTTDEFASKLF